MVAESRVATHNTAKHQHKHMHVFDTININAAYVWVFVNALCL